MDKSSVTIGLLGHRVDTMPGVQPSPLVWGLSAPASCEAAHQAYRHVYRLQTDEEHIGPSVDPRGWFASSNPFRQIRRCPVGSAPARNSFTISGIDLHSEPIGTRWLIVSLTRNAVPLLEWSALPAATILRVCARDQACAADRAVQELLAMFIKVNFVSELTHPARALDH